MAVTVTDSVKQQALPSVRRHAEAKVKQMFDFIVAQGDADYIGESISQLEHSLQCAAMATKANADDETILAALLHDVGRFIPAATKMEKMICKDGTNVGIQSHEVLGENYLREIGFSEKICQLVGAHVVAKRYLTAVDKEYYDALSEASKRTLKFQGGIFSEEQVKEAQKDPWLQEKLAVRRWDDQAKVPNIVSPALSTYEPIARRELLRNTSQFSVCGKTYFLPTRPTVLIYVQGLDAFSFENIIGNGNLSTLSSIANCGFYNAAGMNSPLSPNGREPSPAREPETTNGSAQIEENIRLHESAILAEMHRRGVRVASFPTGQELHQSLSNDRIYSNYCSAKTHNDFSKSSEKIKYQKERVGKRQFSQYPAEPSIAVLDDTVKLLRENKVDVICLALSIFGSCRTDVTEDSTGLFLTTLDEKLDQMIDIGADIALSGILTTKCEEQQTSHGGRTERCVPLMRSRPLVANRLAADSKKWQNTELADLALNW